MLLALGLGLLIGAMYSYNSTRTFLASSVQTQGVLLDYEVSSGEDGDVYCPVVQFTTAQGQEIIYHSNTGSNMQPWAIGSAVKMRYDSQNPSRARIDSWFGLWFLTLILGALGGMFVVVPIIVFIVLLRQGAPASG